MNSTTAPASLSELPPAPWKPANPPQRSTALSQAALLLLGIILAATIVGFVHLREDRSFWLDGSAPARLRSFVCEMFYPLVWFQTVLLFRVTWTFLTTGLRCSRLGLAEAAIVCLLWSTQAFSLLFAVENNVANILEGRPLHWHPEEFASFGSHQFGS